MLRHINCAVRGSLYWLLLILIPLVLLFHSFITNLDDRSNYHGDENVWIPISFDSFKLLFIDHELFSPFWKDDYYRYGAYNPPISKYIIGSGMYLAGYRAIPYMAYVWDQPVTWNIEHGYVFDSNVVRAARVPIALTGFLSCVMLFWIVVLVADRWHAFVAVGYLAGGRLLLNASRRAMLDSPALCFGLLAIVCLWYLLRSIRAGAHYHAFMWASAVGCACSLAVGSKMTALLVPLTCGMVLVLEWIICLFKRRDSMIVLLCSLIVVFVSALVFVASNPFLYTDPIAGTAHMLDFARIVAEEPSAGKTTTLVAKFEALRAYNLYYAPLNQLGLSGDGWLWLAGVVGLLVTAWRSPALFWERSLGPIAVWIVVTYIGIWLWLPNAWDRYTLPVQPCSAFLEAFGTLWLVQVGSRLWYTYVKREV